MKMNRMALRGKSAAGVSSLAVATAMVFLPGLSSASAANTDTANAKTGWANNGVPTFLNTPKTGTRINKPAKNTVFACIKVPVPGTPFTGKIGPHLGRSLTQAKTPWVQDNKVIIDKIEVMTGSEKFKSELKITEIKSTRHFKSNGMPNHPIGIFPIPKDSKAYKYYAALPAEGYANAAEIPVAPYNLDYLLPLNPKVAKQPTCIESLMTGLALTGAAWHIEIAANSRVNTFDPNAALPTDNCFGHPYEGEYHYHGYSWKCMAKGKPGQQSPLYGYALDGFGIYGPLDANGKVITNDQLDECHGRVAEVTFNGKRQKMYHYVLNNEYPYSIGCFKGTILKQPNPHKH
jgi:hypothetical protein